jgi:hypothetical protein
MAFLADGMRLSSFEPEVSYDGAESVHRGPGLDVQALELLIDQAYQRGRADGWSDRDTSTDGEKLAAQQYVAHRIANRVLNYLTTFLFDLESIFEATPADPDPERPAREWVDDRADRLTKLLTGLRGEIRALGDEYQLEMYGNVGQFPPPLTLWREVMPGEAVPVEVLPADPGDPADDAAVTFVGPSRGEPGFIPDAEERRANVTREGTGFPGPHAFPKNTGRGDVPHHPV